jgi:zinc protease
LTTNDPHAGRLRAAITTPVAMSPALSWRATASLAALIVALPAMRPVRLAAQDTTRLAPPPLTAPIPVDSSVRIGTLPNGLTYYIRVNHKPEKRAELRLVVNAGSILEDSTQLGLAHLVEHMAFDGTTHFKRQQLISYLESTGVRFGADLNASTGFDETVYQLTVPTDSATLLGTGVEILADWAHGLTFDPAELERERKVVVEEWRLGRGAAQRIRDKQFPVLFVNSRYATRLPIGDRHTIETASRAELVRFYHDWYRPDLMAVVAVGDFDGARVERLIRERFTPLTNPKPERPRTVFPVPSDTLTRVAVTTDPEATNSTVAEYYEMPVEHERTVADYRRELVESLYSGMLNDRLVEIAQRAGAPFVGAYSAQGDIVRSRAAYVLSALVKDGGIARGLGAVLTEAERVEQHGFTPTEFERQKANLLRGMENTYAERDKTSSDAFVQTYVANFLDGDPIPSIAQDYRLTRALLPGIALSEVNRVAHDWLSLRDRTIVASAPSKDSASVPGDAALLALADSMDHVQVAAYVDSVSNAPLVARQPEPGRVVAESRDAKVGVTTWTLSNGAHVLLKPTTFKDDELLFRAYSPGGTSLAPDSLAFAARTASDAVETSGVGTFSASALQKALAGKSVGISSSITLYEDGLYGGGSPLDADALFQLIYLYFTAPRADTAAFNAFGSRMKALLANRDASPSAAFADTVSATLSRHNPRVRPLTVAAFDSLDLGASLAFYRARFADASAFTFVFVGNIDTTKLRPLVERYIASLPATHQAGQWRDLGIDYPRGVITRDVRKGTDPKSQTRIAFTGPFEYTQHDVYQMEALADVLEIELRERLRQQLGATYSVSVTPYPARIPRPRFYLAIDFGSSPANVRELVQAVFATIDTLKTRGPAAADVKKVRETELRQRETAVRQNGFWLAHIVSYEQAGWPLDDILDFPAQADSLSVASLRDAARTFLDTRNYVQVSLYPDSTK